ncbi:MULTISPECIES: ROK family transcriptional regulator [unclassified Arthrobacter]|uniref:ROK family transcriptional regulator n=1 Tax=unclassified Arthrobacter TaxID=235627 RepID=UPI001D139F48|nr:MULTISPECIES: ROK family transcriptional regulator [unclassified Arthrobacter]MCC3277337.1 ROK family transcriptional regulator [Arthrobacter sp. zg-Y20]MCC9178191.1 ROK family transcriptional regulator [Arthrobacter sp. zg-Y750]MDK1317497.1 ROK family transcriptional regulator [Arthrobacter sp. zg.Y20]WIB07003.1 ROK family transcriptional regulator [Arthrobacter sp. zg-Y20]
MPADPSSALRTVPTTGSESSKPGSQSALRERNRQRIITALLASGPQTQAELSRQTGLSSATVSNIVRQLHEDHLVSTEPTTSSGRRALSVRLNDTGAVAAGIDIGRRHVRVVLASLGYRILQEESVQLPLGHSAAEGMDAAAALLARLLRRQGVNRSAVLGAGVGIPGPIDRRTGTVVQGAILPEWVGINMRADLADRLGMPVFIDNDANLGALAEVTWGPHGGTANLIFIKVASGIGAGLIINGSLYYGHVGITGEIGHATINEQGVICRCGNRGCLETIASTSTMIELLGRASNGPVTTADILARAAAKDPATLRVIDDAGVAVGRAASNLANTLNPETIVIGGSLTDLGDCFLEPVRRGLLRHAVPLVDETTAVQMSSLGDRAEALGAAALVLQEQGAPAR